MHQTRCLNHIPVVGYSMWHSQFKAEKVFLGSWFDSRVWLAPMHKQDGRGTWKRKNWSLHGSQETENKEQSHRGGITLQVTPQCLLNQTLLLNQTVGANLSLSVLVGSESWNKPRAADFFDLCLSTTNHCPLELCEKPNDYEIFRCQHCFCCCYVSVVTVLLHSIICW